MWILLASPPQACSDQNATQYRAQAITSSVLGKDEEIKCIQNWSPMATSKEIQRHSIFINSRMVDQENTWGPVVMLRTLHVWCGRSNEAYSNPTKYQGLLPTKCDTCTTINEAPCGVCPTIYVVGQTGRRLNQRLKERIREVDLIGRLSQLITSWACCLERPPCCGLKQDQSIDPPAQPIPETNILEPIHIRNRQRSINRGNETMPQVYNIYKAHCFQIRFYPDRMSQVFLNSVINLFHAWLILSSFFHWNCREIPFNLFGACYIYYI